VFVIEGVNEDRAGLVRESSCFDQRFIDRGAVEADVGAVAACCFYLRDRCINRHEHRDVHAEELSGKCNTLGMVARAGRHHAFSTFGFSELGNAVIRSSNLEGTSPLQVFRNQVDRTAYLIT